MKVLKKLSLEDVLFIDIETATQVKRLQLDTPLFDSWAYKMQRENLDNVQLIESYDKDGGLYPEYGKIVCISIGRIFKGDFVTTTFNDPDEKEIIKKFNAILDKEDWIICGHYIKTFDIPYIFKRSLVNGIVPHPLMDISGEKPWTMDWIYDTKELWAAGGLSHSTLISITTVFGLPSPKSGVDGSDITKHYWDDPVGHIQEISEYCERDVTAVYEIMKIFKNPVNVDKPTEMPPLVQHLFDGGKYTASHHKKLEEFLLTLPAEEQASVFTILDSIVSTAAGKKTNLTKAHTKKLKEICQK